MKTAYTVFAFIAAWTSALYMHMANRVYQVPSDTSYLVASIAFAGLAWFLFWLGTERD